MNWSPQEDEQLRTLKALRTPDKVIARRLGRTPRAVTSRWEYINFSPEQKAHKQAMKNKRRMGKARPYTPVHIDMRLRGFRIDDRRIVVPAHVWAERNARLAQRTSSAV